jgi:uncharacterized YceG family protein
VDEQPQLSPSRRSPTAPVTGRRLLALALIGAVIGLGAWLAISAVDTIDASDDPQPPPVTTVAAPAVLRIIFPEGFTRAQMAARVGAVHEIARQKRSVTPRLTERGYLTATARAVPPIGFREDAHGRIEGFLFPATYAFFADETSTRFVRRQLEAFRRAWRKVDLTYARSKNLTPYDVLIIASMIEREVQVPQERRLVAAVIYNRLRARMPLGIDATLRYGLDIPPTAAITKAQLASGSPYNTRRFPGLPPTPIANPGLASIQAAAHPAQVPYLYYVRKADCRSHFFTASPQEFLAYPRDGLRC